MKICFYCDTIFTFGGVQRVLAVIAKSLASHHDVTILTLDNPSTEDTAMYDLNESNIHFQYISYPQLSKIEYFPCKAYSYLYKKALPHTKLTSRWYGYSSFPASQRKILIKKLNSEKYDVIIGVHAFLSLRLASIRKRLRTPQIIGWMHNSFQAFFENKSAYLKGFKEYFHYQMQHLDKIIVLTHTDADLYRKEFHLSPTVIYNPLTLLPKGRGNLDAKKFLTVGRFSPLHKGFDLLIEGFAIFAKENKEWTLDIVGEGPEETMVRGLISKHNLEKRITIYPFTKEVQNHYASASVYVLSSRWEGFPLVLAEAMAHGLPIIASDIPIVNEFLLGKENAMIFQKENITALANTMLKIVNSNKIQQMSDASYALAQSLQLPSVIKEWDNVLSTGQ